MKQQSVLYLICVSFISMYLNAADESSQKEVRKLMKKVMDDLVGVVSAKQKVAKFKKERRASFQAEQGGSPREADPEVVKLLKITSKLKKVDEPHIPLSKSSSEGIPKDYLRRSLPSDGRVLALRTTNKGEEEREILHPNSSESISRSPLRRSPPSNARVVNLLRITNKGGKEGELRNLMHQSSSEHLRRSPLSKIDQEIKAPEEGNWLEQLQDLDKPLIEEEPLT